MHKTKKTENHFRTAVPRHFDEKFQKWIIEQPSKLSKPIDCTKALGTSFSEGLSAHKWRTFINASSLQ